MKAKIKSQSKRVWYLSVLAIELAGILYCSWPLGYYLNPKVSAHGLASELGAVGQPYNWVFISGDVLAGLLVIVGAVALWWFIGRTQKRWVREALFLYGLFGLFTAIDAVMPMKCVPSLTKCPAIGSDPLLIVHGIASILSATCLFLSAFVVWRATTTRQRYIIMSFVMASWAIFGVSSVVFFFVPGPGYLAQHYFISICSLWVMLLPLVVVHSMPLTKNVKLAQLRG